MVRTSSHRHRPNKRLLRQSAFFTIPRNHCIEQRNDIFRDTSHSSRFRNTISEPPNDRRRVCFLFGFSHYCFKKYYCRFWVHSVSENHTSTSYSHISEKKNNYTQDGGRHHLFLSAHLFGVEFLRTPESLFSGS